MCDSASTKSLTNLGVSSPRKTTLICSCQPVSGALPFAPDSSPTYYPAVPSSHTIPCHNPVQPIPLPLGSPSPIFCLPLLSLRKFPTHDGIRGRTCSLAQTSNPDSLTVPLPRCILRNARSSSKGPPPMLPRIFWRRRALDSSTLGFRMTRL